MCVTVYGRGGGGVCMCMNVCTCMGSFHGGGACCSAGGCFNLISFESEIKQVQTENT